LTPEERFAWAAEHGVTPPPYAEKPRSAGWNTPRQRDLAAAKPATKPKCPHCRADETESAACCSAKQSCCQQTAANEKSKSTGWHWQIGNAALKCRGLSTLWMMSGAVAPPPPIVNWQPQLVAAEWIAPPSPTLVGISSAPLDPPPRPSSD
jgi:hypothetical protein